MLELSAENIMQVNLKCPSSYYNKSSY